jgi:hypothetical protein
VGKVHYEEPALEEEITEQNDETQGRDDSAGVEVSETT